MKFTTDMSPREICSSMVSDTYSKLTLLGEAQKVFDEMPERDITTWNTLISGYHQNGQFSEAVKLFTLMVFFC
jgi:pentatricopeptide repeat protein